MLHLVLSVTVYGLGRYALLPGTFDENGVGVAFASDGVRYRADAAVLSDALRRGEIRSWAGADRPFHVKLYAVCFALFGPWLGYTVVGAEPLNALFYLAGLVLVFGLGREVFDRRAGLLAAGMVAFWPSYLLHTTQFLKDPLFVVGMLALILINVRWLKRDYSWARAVMTGVAGGAIVTALWLARGDMGEILVSTVLLGAVLLVARTLTSQNRRAGNLAGMALLVAATLGVPLLMPNALELGRSPSAARRSERGDALRQFAV